ncbi:hypothetical protein NMG60_11002723 [Bertholletia excelsa]
MSGLPKPTLLVCRVWAGLLKVSTLTMAQAITSELAFNFKVRASLSSAATSAMATKTKVVPAIIVGGGRVGRMLQELGNGEDVLVKKGENDDLEAVLQSTPKSRWNDQVLAYFAVSKLGEPPVDGKTDTNPDGLTAAFGKWADAVAARLHGGGLSCKEKKDSFQKQMLEKLIWIQHSCLLEHRIDLTNDILNSQVSSLITELASAAAAEKGISFEVGLEDRLCAYARSVAHFPTAVKEFKWRNGWFHSLSENSIAQGKPDPCPQHTAMLKELKIV